MSDASLASKRIHWRALIGFELAWFGLVYFQQLAFWPVLAYLFYGLWCLSTAKARLAVVVFALLGIALDTILVKSGILSFAELPWLPVWFLLLWCVFALALVEVMHQFLKEPKLAFILGAVGGPLSYIGGAALSNGIMTFPAGLWSYLILGLCWGALAVLFGYCRRWYA